MGPFSSSHCASLEGTHARVGGSRCSPSDNLSQPSGRASCHGITRPHRAPSRMTIAEGPWVVMPTLSISCPRPPNHSRRFFQRPSDEGQTCISDVESELSKSTLVALVPTSIPRVSGPDMVERRSCQFIASSLHRPAKKSATNSEPKGPVRDR